MRGTGVVSLAGRLLVPLFACVSPVMAAGEGQEINVSAVSLFLLFVVITLGICYWASKRTRTSGEFYTAGGKITGIQNGTAVAGDFMSAASFLGVTALVYAGGVDALVIGIGAFAGWPIMLFLLSERVRNLGRYTFTDVIALRLDRTRTRTVMATSTIIVVIFYLVSQMVAAGHLVELLFGLPYEVAIVVVSLLVMIYVAFGGMLATTWVQIIKAVLLLLGGTIMTVLILYQVGFSFDELLRQAVDRHPLGEDILKAGVLFKGPVQVATILVSMMFGILGLPHILMRLFTVPSMREARTSIFCASLLIGYFYLLVVIIGFATIAFLVGRPEFYTESGQLIGGGNMASIHLARVVGGDLLMGFMSAVAFATILAVVAGLTVSGSAAVSHDLYSQVICKGNPDPKKELRLTKITTLVMGLLAIIFGLLFKDQNVGFIAVMPLVVAASVNFPALFMSLFWPGMTTRGVVWGVVVGLVLSVGLIIVGPQVWVEIIGFERPLFPYSYPALFCMPFSFAAIWWFSVTDKSERGDVDRENYQKLLLKSEFGE